MKYLSTIIPSLVFTSFTFSAAVNSIYAQTPTIKGKVILESGEPASWVEIQALDTQYGTVTDSLGKYSLALKDGPYTLTYSSIGYTTSTETINVSDSTATTLPVVVLKEDTDMLGTVIIRSKPKMRVKRENGQLAVSVSQTDFEDQRNVWEGLKKTPLIDVTNQDGIQVFGQNALIKINGVETQLSGENLEDYLKSLPPKTIEKIEIQPNPGSEYESNVKAVVNIILKKGVENYQVGLRTENGSRSRYYNKSGFNYALNKEKIRIYTNYDFSYQPIERTGEVAQQVPDQPLTEYQTRSIDKTKAHHATLNIDLDLSPKDNLTLSNLLNFSNTDNEGLTSTSGFERQVRTENKGHQLQFSQVWKHAFNDTVSLKIGAHEVFQNSRASNQALNTDEDIEKQHVKTNIPIYIGFLDYKNKNRWGTTTAGLKYNDISVGNKNESVGEKEVFAPYQYDERVFAAYLGHQIPFKNGASLQLGLRSETSMIDYEFNSPTKGESFQGSPRYTDFLYNMEYNWGTSTGRIYNVSFNKSVDRPNYSYLNPFQEISSDILYSSGDTDLDRTQSYILSFYTHKSYWTFSVAGVYLHNYITQFFDEREGRINLTYRNFKDVYAAQASAQFNKSFFNDIWQSKTSFTISQIDIKDPNYEVGKITPNIWLSTNHSFELLPDLKLDLDVFLVPPFKQGILEMYNTNSSVDLSITKKWGSNFTLNFFVNDIFKSNTFNTRTTVPNYFYSDNTYGDTRMIGVSLRYSLTGSSYKGQQIQRASDSSIDRLN